MPVIRPQARRVSRTRRVDSLGSRLQAALIAAFGCSRSDVLTALEAPVLRPFNWVYSCPTPLPRVSLPWMRTT